MIDSEGVLESPRGLAGAVIISAANKSACMSGFIAETLSVSVDDRSCRSEDAELSAGEAASMIQMSVAGSCWMRSIISNDVSHEMLR